MQRTVAIAGSVLWAALCAANASASQLFATAFDGPTPLYSIDQSSGALSTVGPTGFGNVADLTSDPLTGTLWGIEVSGNHLLKIDHHTGAGTQSVALDSDNPIVSIAFDPITRQLYGNTSVGFGATGQDALYRIDPVSGHTTLIGSLGSFEQVFGLAFDQHGTLFGIANQSNELIKIDTATGIGSLIPGASQLTFPNNFDLASRPEDNTMFVANASTASLYILDTSTGDLTPVGPFGGQTNIAGLAFLTSVPEPSAYIGLAAGLLVLVLARRRAH